MLVCAFPTTHAHETAGAARTRSSLRPLHICEGKNDAKLGHIMPRECGPTPSRCLNALFLELDNARRPITAYDKQCDGAAMKPVVTSYSGEKFPWRLAV